MMNWYTLHVDDHRQRPYTAIHPTRARALNARERAGYGRSHDDLVRLPDKSYALVTEHEVPFSEGLLVGLILAAACIVAVIIALSAVAFG